jgi:hypothetical protein
MGLTRRRLQHGAAAAAMLPASALLHADPAAPGALRVLRFTLTATNPTLAALERQAVWIYMPMRMTSTQVLEQLAVSVPHQLMSDPLGHSIVRLDFESVPPLASRIVSFTAQVRLAPQPVPQALMDSQAWLRAQRFIEVDDPAVRACAAPLRRAGALDTATAIYDWVRANLRYAGYLADELGARVALETRRGDCTEYACLAVALARANGIPARTVGGYVAPGSIAPRPQDYHDWAELYVDGAWRTLDAQKEQWSPHPAGYVAFHIGTAAALNPIGLAHRFQVDGALRVRL